MGKVVAKTAKAKISTARVTSSMLLALLLVGCLGTAGTAFAALLHSSANLGTKYGTWGGSYTCATCHNDNTRNIKMVNYSVATPTGKRAVTFSRLTASQNSTVGVYGNDQRTYATNGSTNICEVCHHQPTHHQYSASKVTSNSHYNNQDCTGCHQHSKAFAAPVGGACNSCHGDPPTTGKHASHIAISMTCPACHNGTPVNAFDRPNMSSGNGSLNLGFNVVTSTFTRMPPKLTAIKSGTVTTNTAGVVVTAPTTQIVGTPVSCTVYCHGGWSYSGGGGVASATGTVVQWTATKTCNMCHYTSATEVDNVSASGLGTSAQTHLLHAGSTTTAPRQGYACGTCHTVPTGTDTTHVNGDSKVVLATGTYKGFGNFTSMSVASGSGGSYGSCNATVCHGSKSPAAWGTSYTRATGGVCFTCHGSQSAAFTNTSAATVAPGGSNIDTNRVTGNTTRGGMHQEHLTGTNGITGVKVKCGECHSNRPQNNTYTQVQAAPHLQTSTARLSFTGRAVLKSHTPTLTRTSGVISCATTYCHTATMNSGTGLAPAWNNTAYLSGPAPTVADCNKCHGLPPRKTFGHASTAVITLATSIGPTCSSLASGCHTSVKATTATFAITDVFTDTTLHMNGDGNGGDCVGCHQLSQNGKRAIITGTSGQFGGQSHHIQGVAVTDKKMCYVCHNEADVNGAKTGDHLGANGGSVDLALWSAGARTATYIRYTANSANRSQAVKLTQFCLGCHSAAAAASQPFAAFGDTRTPIAYAWDGRSVEERYSQTTTTVWSNYSTNNTNKKRGTTKALSAHGNAANNDQGYSATVGTDGRITDTTGNVNVVCFDCHNSHGSAVAGVTSNYSSATGRNKGGILKQVTAGLGGYAATYQPAASSVTYKSGSVATFNPGADLCFDCHNNRTASTTMPWGYNSTYGASQPILGYMDTPYFGNYTMASAKRTAYKLGGTVGSANDRRKPMGGHYGTSVSGDSVSARAAGKINGLCTPCHDPHGVTKNTALVANGTKAVPLLKGTWVTSPYLEDKADIAVARGGGSKFAYIAGGANIPGYHIDQNTLLQQPAPNKGPAATSLKSDQRRQAFRNFSNAGLKLHTEKTVTEFAGLCNNCHNQLALTGSATKLAAPATWKTKERIHQAVAGNAATTGSNTNNVIHAYTCSKCHTPHVSRLPRLMVTNCLNVNHKGQVVTGGSVSATAGSTTANSGQILQSTVSSGKGAGRFPGGGGRYNGSASSAQNPGPWWFQTTVPTAASYGSNCHNAANAGGTTYNPTNQQWNNRTPW
jgi:cytochrome c7-like protein